MQMYAGGSASFTRKNILATFILLAMANWRTFHASSRRLAVTTETCWATNLPGRAPTTFQRRGGCTTITDDVCKRRTWFRCPSRCYQTRFADKSSGQFSNERKTLSLSLSLSLSLHLIGKSRSSVRGFVSNITWNSRD